MAAPCGDALLRAVDSARGSAEQEIEEDHHDRDRNRAANDEHRCSDLLQEVRGKQQDDPETKHHRSGEELERPALPRLELAGPSVHTNPPTMASSGTTYTATYNARYE